MSLSRNKTNFLNDKEQLALNRKKEVIYQLEVDDLHNLANYYNNKYGINIVINADTLLGQQMVLESARIKEQMKALPNILDRWRFIEYVAYYWRYSSIKKKSLYECVPSVINEIIKNRCLDKMYECRLTDKQNNEVTSVFKEMLLVDDYGYIKKITPALRIELHSKLAKIFNGSRDDKSNIFTHRLRLNINAVYQQADICLNKYQAFHEIEFIQRSLKQDEAIGYVFANDVRTLDAHFEALIITNSRIVKPLHWDDEYNVFNPIEFPTIYNTSNWVYSGPQRTSYECGALCFAYLKELLKNNAEQLNNYSLSFSIYKFESSPASQRVFIPSPQVLSYSQDFIHVRHVTDMMSTNRANAHKLDWLLNTSIEIATARGDRHTLNEHAQLLKRLPAFRDKWLREYASVKLKRDLFTTNEEDHNQHLVYTAYRMLQHSKQNKRENDFLFLKFMKAISVNPQLVFIQEDVIELVNHSRFKSLLNMDQQAVLIGFLIKKSLDSRKIENIKFLGFTLFKYQKGPDVADFLELEIITPWLEKLRISKVDCVCLYKYYEGGWVANRRFGC